MLQYGIMLFETRFVTMTLEQLKDPNFKVSSNAYLDLKDAMNKHEIKKPVIVPRQRNPKWRVAHVF